MGNARVETMTTHHIRARAGRMIVDLEINEEQKVENLEIRIQRQDQSTPDVIGNVVEVDLNDLAAAIHAVQAQVEAVRRAGQAQRSQS